MSDNLIVEQLEHTTGWQTQAGRQLAAQHSDYAPIEDRTRADWLHYLYQIAQHIRFYNLAGEPDGNWQPALPRPDQIPQVVALLEHNTPAPQSIKDLVSRPDCTLLLAFLQMLETPLAQYRGYTQRHLTHYYRDQLGFVPRPAQPDHSHLIITLAPDEPSLRLPAGTEFHAGEDADGNPIHYATRHPRLLNQAQIARVLTRIREPSSERQWLTQCVEQQQPRLTHWATFGDPNVPQAQPLNAGLCFATPALHLAGGTRTLTLRIDLQEPVPQRLTHYFRISLTQADGKQAHTMHWQQTQHTLEGTLTLSPQHPPITHTTPGAQPGLTLTLAADAPAELIRALRSNRIRQARLTIQVTAAPGLIINNHEGVLDTDKPSTPFTQTPRPNTTCQFTHPELLLKPIQHASLNLHWQDLPDNWDQYYQPYLRYRHRNTPDTQARYHWPNNTVQIDTATQPDTQPPVPLFSTRTPLAFITPERPQTHLPYNTLPTAAVHASDWPHWYQLRLSGNDFGHTEYAQVAQYQALYEQTRETLWRQQVEQQVAQDTSQINQNTSNQLNTALATAELSPTTGQNSLTQSTPGVRPAAAASPAAELTAQIARIVGDATKHQTPKQTNGSQNTEQTARQTETDKKTKPLSAEEQKKAQEKAKAKALVQLAGYARLQAEATVRAEIRANAWIQQQTEQPGTTNPGTAEPANHRPAPGQSARKKKDQEQKTPTPADQLAIAAQEQLKRHKEIVNPPYTPTLEKISLNYQTEIEFNLTTPHPQHQISQIQPLGQIPLHQVRYRTLIPPEDTTGDLYIALQHCPTPGECTLYFHLEDAEQPNRTAQQHQHYQSESADEPNQTTQQHWHDHHRTGARCAPQPNLIEQPKLHWHYLREQTWHRFDRPDGPAKIVEDTTDQLQRTGLITFRLPRIRDHYLQDHHIWLRFSMAEHSTQQQNPRHIHQITTQGIQVTLSNQPHASHYIRPLPAQQISATVAPEPRIARIHQPNPSYGGRPAETETQLQQRASERLRHKHRAITSWDYERLVLARFPELYAARCYRTDTDTTLVVLPISHTTSNRCPKLSAYQQHQIEHYLTTISPHGQTIRLLSPAYHEIQLQLYLTLADGHDPERVRAELNQQLQNILTPWHPDTSHRTFSDRPNLTRIAGQLERHPAILSIARIRHISPLPNTLPPHTLLIPAPEHEIHLQHQEPDYLDGIEVWEMEHDFHIG
ncbi:MAG: hypothetical protein AAF669_06810 [Pseudomonadota bacterium]